MILESIAKKYVDSIGIDEHKENIYELQDKVASELASLISDVARGEASRSVLVNQVEKIVLSSVSTNHPEKIVNQIIDNIYGYGWLQRYIDDPLVSDIDVMSYDSVMIRKQGVYEFVPSEFVCEKELFRFLKYVVIRNGGSISESKPHCRVADIKHRLRINACMPPRNSTGPSITIRKHSNTTRSLEDLAEIGMLTSEQLALLKKVCSEKQNILICGKGAAGKTTLLRAIIAESDDMERILVCEKDAEIFPEKKNCMVQRISKRVNGLDEHDLNTLIEEGLTMSLDTYCIGEITGKEAWPLVKAGFSDHRTLATIHAKSAFDALDRLLMLCVDDNRLSEEKIRQMIVRSIDMVIYMRKFRIEEIYYPSDLATENKMVGSKPYTKETLVPESYAEEEQL